jgi:hypothetical protein
MGLPRAESAGSPARSKCSLRKRDEPRRPDGTNAFVTPATLQSVGGGVYNLIYLVDVTLNLPITAGVTANIEILGTINAQGTIAVPEPTSSSLLAVTGVATLLARLRSRRWRSAA